VRGGITLTSNFTATVDATLKVSTVSETVEVQGSHRGRRDQRARADELLEGRPGGDSVRARHVAILSAAPAVQMARIDVGGSTAGTQTSYRAYGVSGQTKPLIERIIGLEGSGSVGFYYDYGSFEEVNVQTAAQGAETRRPA